MKSTIASWLLLAALLTVVLAAACGDDDDGGGPADRDGDGPTRTVEVAATPELQITLTSEAIGPGGTIAEKYTCDGDNVSPPLAWSGAPAGTQSFALVLDDPDAGGFTHWSIYNIPATTVSLAEGTPPESEGQGMNGFGETGYGGPCPPEGETHTYRFRLYALDGTLDLPDWVTQNVVLEGVSGRLLAVGTLTGTYGR